MWVGREWALDTGRAVAGADGRPAARALWAQGMLGVTTRSFLRSGPLVPPAADRDT